MPEYRRAYVPGGTFFFTLVVNQRRPIFRDPANVERLRAAMRAVQSEWPFDPVAGVVLLDHLHLIWTLCDGDSDYSKRIGRIKALFTRSLAGTTWDRLSSSAAGSRRRHHESDVWQRRFWEHVIRDPRDFENHLNYLHYNPVKHGLCTCPHAWPASSFRHWVNRKAYEPDWCCSCARAAAPSTSAAIPLPYPEELDATVGE
jgi:putative transposase